MRFGFSRTSGQRPAGPRLSATTVGAAAGAGFAAALMVVAVVKNVSGAVAINAAETGLPPGLILPLIMILIVPLPLMIVTIGFGRLAGMAAVVIGAVAVALYALMPSGAGSLDFARLGVAGTVALAFVVVVGVPSTVLGRLAVRRRVKPPEDAQALPRVRPEEQVLGSVVGVAIAYTATLLAIFIVLAISDGGGLAAVTSGIAEQIKRHPAALSQIPKGIDLTRIVHLELWVSVFAMAAFGVATLACNLWLSARIAQTSGLLAEPWPDIPRNLRLPRPLAPVLAVALGLSFAGGLVGLISAVATGALTAGFIFQGLAVIHVLTIGSRMRPTLLTLVYFLLIVMPIPLIYALIGLLDVFFAFRDRQKPVVIKKKP